MKKTTVKKILSALTVLFVAFNCIVPAAAYDCGGGFLSGLIENQSNVLYFASLSVIPVKIMNEIFVRMGMTLAPQKKTQPKEQKTSKNTSADFSIVKDLQKNEIKSHENRQRFARVNAVPISAARSCPADIPLANFGDKYGGGGLPLLFAVMFLVCLARRGIPAAAVIIIRNT